MKLLHRAAPLAAGWLTALALAGCGATDIASGGGDRVVPSVSLSLMGNLENVAGEGAAPVASVSVRLPLQVRVQASDNAAIHSVVTRVYADTAEVTTDSAVVNASTSVDRTVTLSLLGVASGQVLTIVSDVYDASGNRGSAQVVALAVDPNVPSVQFFRPAATVIAGGTFTIDIIVADTMGISKVGYSAQGAGMARADSALFSGQLPVIDTVSFLLTVPGSATPGQTFSIAAFAENRDGLRATGQPLTVRIQAPGADTQMPLVHQTVPARLESADSILITARDSDGLVRVVGFTARDAAGFVLHEKADTLLSPAQQVTRRIAFAAPVELRGRAMFITSYAIDVAGHTGYAVPNGGTVAQGSAALALREQAVYAYGLTFALPPGSLGADIAVDTTRSTVFVSNINKNQLEAWSYSTTLSPLPSVAVGAMPWGMMIDNSNSLLLVANSGGTNISRVNLNARLEQGRIKTANEYLFDVQYSKDETSGGFKFQVSAPIDYSDRPQYIQQSASGALYYSTRPTSTATPGTLRRIDNFLDARTEPRQIWQYGKFAASHYVIVNADAVDVVKGQNGVPDEIIICDHTPGDEPSTATCVQSGTIEAAVAQLRSAPVNGNVEAVKDLSVESLALPDTNFVAAGGDRRRVVFGEANTGGRAGRVLAVFDPSGTPAGAEVYSAPIEVTDLTNNASDQVFGIAINKNSANIGVHGVETFFADSSLRLQGKFATFNTGAGIAFHPDNVDEQMADSLARVAFVASGDRSIQIVDSYSYRLRGRIPIRANLYGPLRAVPPTPAERAADPTLAVKLFGLTPEGIVVIDIRRQDIDNARLP